jgi:hypothetical protein
MFQALKCKLGSLIDIHNLISNIISPLNLKECLFIKLYQIHGHLVNGP